MGDVEVTSELPENPVEAVFNDREAVTRLELIINPDISDGAAVASLAEWGIYD